MTVMLSCKCDSCFEGAHRIARDHPGIELEEPIGNRCRREPLIEPVLVPVSCPHCGSGSVDLGVTGLHLCNSCGGLFREEDRVLAGATARQNRIEEDLR